ncbi:TPA: hypothetical protein EYP44_01435 [Candidatus Bathyarchaeota archaeon]|nr:hypothetical protein [Candidatus Bathyarchaeota archaeon]
MDGGIGPALGYVVVRCYGLRGRLLTPTLMRSLVSAKGLRDLVSLLLDTDYGGDIEGVAAGEVGAPELERIFDEKLIERCGYVARIAPRRIADFLRAYYRKFEVLNIKRILRGKVSRLPAERIKGTLFPTGRLFPTKLDALLEAKSLEDAVNALNGTIYAPVRSYNDLTFIESYLDKIYADSILGPVISNVPRRARGLVRHTLGVMMGISTWIRPTIPKRLLGALGAPRTETAMKPVMEIGLSTQGWKYVYDKVREASKRRRLDFASIWFYILSCEVERKDLISIAWGKQNNIEPERILEYTVIPHYATLPQG